MWWKRWPGMSDRPVTIFFDVNETLSDLSTIGDAFATLGADRHWATTWFSNILRDGFALTSAGSDAKFADIARNTARGVLHTLPLDLGLDAAVDVVMDALMSVHLHPDVAGGIRSLHEAGHRLFTLSNGSTASAERMLREAGILTAVDGLLSVEGHSPWKPARASYLDALARTSTEGPAYLVAVHPWDIHGAASAGLSTVWINRSGALYPGHFHTPTFVTITVGEIAGLLIPDPAA